MMILILNLIDSGLFILPGILLGLYIGNQTIRVKLQSFTL